MENDIKKLALIKKLPTTTAHQSRLQMFQPTRRPKNEIWTTETPWGSAKVHGRIGQGHADVLESIFFNAAGYKNIEEGTEKGSMQILVDPHKVRSTVGREKVGGSHLEKLITELMQVVIETVVSKTGVKTKFHIINRVVDSPFIAETRSGAIGKDRKIWRVDISSEFMEIMRNDLNLYYDPAPIALLTSGVSAAIVRHVITHKNEPNGGWTLDGLIKAVGGGKTTKSLRDHRADVISDKNGLENNGLCLSEGRLTRIKKGRGDAHIPGEAIIC